MELTEAQTRKIVRTINIAANASWEGDVSGLAFALLRYTGLDIDNGYLITSENRFKEESRKKGDILVEILISRQKVLIIECKYDTSHPTRDKQQLKGYMQEGFPNGILMYPRKSTFYSLNLEQDDAEVLEGNTYNNVTDYEEIMNGMFNMRVRELEEGN
ncbi:hypothetical protein CONCODRAFT_9764 [Conidiobolus coronatus NRRL 28638]|uniref:Type I restriction enzyme R protein N-terminal domain-containing protein n=1 Tax=Conidiobolus coronatus (strain ATCC 28846 / CBS 209.66 / NRRL 28638) TaxID=796925 RepID=A0A137NZN1_CONC2|nr:hypothetical protein CONCODRAFT_9764 [Conidiobolus coronatus NRRL 28638]|eukprot:KXN68039.1 hypothetical protein CONCODRAFT_9764 [Conidiobolus coronatus NRRL 28638]